MAGAAIRLRRKADDLREIPKSGMIAAARAVKKVADEEAARVSGGDGRLTGKKRRGLKLRARDKIEQRGTSTFCRVQGVSPAAWVWVNTGTDPHRIRRRKRGKNAKLRAMTVPHPGTAGAGAWRRVRRRSEVIVPQIFRDAVNEVIRR